MAKMKMIKALGYISLLLMVEYQRREVMGDETRDKLGMI